jgi:WD40 repeat protein
VQLWDLETGIALRFITVIPQAHSNLPYAFGPTHGFSIKYGTVGILAKVASGLIRTIKAVECEVGECLKTFWGHTDWVQAIAFSPNGKTLVSGSCDNTVSFGIFAPVNVYRL